MDTVEAFDAAATASANKLVLSALIQFLDAHVVGLREDLQAAFTDLLGVVDADEGPRQTARRKVVNIALETVSRQPDRPILTLVPHGTE